MQPAWAKAVTLLTWIGCAQLASAQSTVFVPASAVEPAAAQELFDEARQLMDAHKYAEACPKFQESQRLDPGIGTLFNLAACYEAIGRTASAWSLFIEVAAAAKRMSQPAREQVARDRARALEPHLPRLQILVPPSARCAGLRIVRAGAEVGDAQWDVALPTDPGRYSITVSAPGKRVWQGEVEVAAAETTTLTVAPLDSESTGRDEQALTPRAEPRSPAQAERGVALSTERWIALGLGGGALVATVVGSVFALNANHENHASRPECPDNRCTQAGLASRNRALADGDRATVAFVAAGALAAGAAVLYFTGGAPSPHEHARVQPWLAPGLAGAAFGGSL